MPAETRRALLSAAGGIVGLAGCLRGETFDPPDIEWSIEENVGHVIFTHDGGESIDDPQRLYYRHGDHWYKPLAYFVDGDYDSTTPPRLTEGDDVIPGEFPLNSRPQFETGETVTLFWRNTSLEEKTALAEHELQAQRTEPPEIQWATDETETHVRFIHTGGDTMDATHNSIYVTFPGSGFRSGIGGPIKRGETVTPDDVLPWQKRLGVEAGDTIQLYWENRHETDDAVLVEHEIEHR